MKNAFLHGIEKSVRWFVPHTPSRSLVYFRCMTASHLVDCGGKTAFRHEGEVRRGSCLFSLLRTRPTSSRLMP